MTGKKIGYIRVSSVDQNTIRQLDGISLEKYSLRNYQVKVLSAQFCWNA